ncbi:glycoside hydrolase family 88 protein [Luteolibacter sp. LG18]|uniref:glycoside hydrolase family 88 protein n=1 Tax=Luteolibacter sp. LG18 TaxID=2819286 RepID=UPI002B30F953|nr:glycosyl hydrolase [Luteolibacter sp. LG18]
MTEETLKSAFDLCVSKTRLNIEAMVDHPTTWAFAQNGDYAAWPEGFFEIGNWTNSFFTGMAVLSWLDTKEPHFLKQLERIEPFYNAKVNVAIHAVETMHDIGFLYSLYSVALYKNTGDKRQRALGLRAAEVLVGRFVPEGNYIRAWGRMDEPDTDYAGLAIIDCMMNLPLLFWAAEETGDARFREIAIRHADTTLANFVRADDSVYHSFRFNADGSPKGGDNYCGRGIESHWARGTTWAMYGFAMAYRYTGDERYLDASLRVTRKFLSLLDDEVVPVWDFRLNPGEPLLRDSSAAAVAACALQELEALGKSEDAFGVAKDNLIARLCSEDYLNADPAVRGLLRDAEVGDGVGKARSAYTSWGDYYFMEALGRELGLAVNWW